MLDGELMAQGSDGADPVALGDQQEILFVGLEGQIVAEYVDLEGQLGREFGDLDNLVAEEIMSDEEYVDLEGLMEEEFVEEVPGVENLTPVGLSEAGMVIVQGLFFAKCIEIFLAVWVVICRAMFNIF